MLCLSLFSYVYTAVCVCVCVSASRLCCSVLGEVKWNNNNNKNEAHWMRLLHIYVNIFAWNAAPLCLARAWDRDIDLVLYTHAHTPDIIIIAVLVVRRPNKRMRWKRRSRRKRNKNIMSIWALFTFSCSSWCLIHISQEASIKHTHKHTKSRRQRNEYPYPFIHSFVHSVCASEWLGDGTHRLCDPF